MQMEHRRRSRALVAATLAAMLAAALVPGIAAAESKVTVVASGLNNPRGVAIGPSGRIYVVEAGTGGTGPCITGAEGEKVCLGDTGAIARVRKGKVTRVVTGLPSLAGPDGSGATGPHKLSFGAYGAYLTIGLGGAPAARATLGKQGRLLGTLARVNLRHDRAWKLADLARYEARKNPDGGDAGSSVDSNPYGVLASRWGAYTTDAGGNDLLFTDRWGRTRTVAVFHATLVDAPEFLGLPAGTQIPMQSVPTSVVRGSRGQLFVGELTGFPFPAGGATIWKVRPGRAPKVFATGFTNIVDMAVGRNGSLYVVEVAKHGLLSEDLTGRLVKVSRNGHKRTLLESPLFAPGGIAIRPNGTIYVTNGSVLPGGGQLLRIRP